MKSLSLMEIKVTTFNGYVDFAQIRFSYLPGALNNNDQKKFGL